MRLNNEINFWITVGDWTVAVSKKKVKSKKEPEPAQDHIVSSMASNQYVNQPADEKSPVETAEPIKVKNNKGQIFAIVPKDVNQEQASQKIVDELHSSEIVSDKLQYLPSKLEAEKMVNCDGEVRPAGDFMDQSVDASDTIQNLTGDIAAAVGSDKNEAFHLDKQTAEESDTITVVSKSKKKKKSNKVSLESPICFLL